MAFKTSNSSETTTPYSGNISNTRGLADITDLDATTIATLKSALTYGYEPYEPTQVLNASSTGLTGADITGLMFGGSLYVYGNYVFISAEQSALGTPPNEYKPPVWVYNVTTGSLVHTLSCPSLDKDSSTFGEAMSISGNYAILGQDRIKNGSTYTNGRVYIYNVATGALVKTIESPDSLGTLESGYFGKSVAIEGNYAIVGAYLQGSDTGADDGKAYIYKTTDGTWSDATLIHTLNNPNPVTASTFDEFGRASAISGNYAMVSAPREDTAPGGTGYNQSGKVYIYNVTTGALVATLINPNAFGTPAIDLFGVDLAMEGRYAIVGATGEDDAGGLTSGKAYIYETTDGTWSDATLIHTLNNPNPFGTSTNDYFGTKVSINSTYAVVSAVGEDTATLTNAGKVYIYNIVTGTLFATLDHTNITTGVTYSFGGFGYDVSMTDDYITISAPGFIDNTDGGKVHIYKISEISEIPPTTTKFITRQQFEDLIP
jgi:hypothetical protein